MENDDETQRQLLRESVEDAHVLEQLVSARLNATKLLLLRDEDLPSSLSGIQEVRRRIRRRRLDVGSSGTCPVVFTAPHTLELLRQRGKRLEVHKREDYTGSLAKHLARVLGGAYVTWAADERARVGAVYKASGRPDASNADPNFLRNDELRGSVWFEALELLRDDHHVHIDIHGMADDTIPDCDLVVGTGAMRRRRGSDDGFVDRLLAGLDELKIDGQPLLYQPKRGGEEPDHFCGDWGNKLGDKSTYNTLTQMTTDSRLFDHPYTHAIQLELSLRLRTHFFPAKDGRKQGKADLAAFCQVIADLIP